MINLLPYKEKRQLHRIFFLRHAIVACIAVVVLVTVAAILFSPTYISVTNRYQLAQEQIVTLKNQDNFFSATDIAALDQKSRSLSQLLTTVPPHDPTMYVKTVQQLTPAAVSINRYAIGDTTSPVLQIFGVARTRTDLEEFVTTLQAAPEIVVVDSPVSNYVKSTDTDFTITITFK